MNDSFQYGFNVLFTAEVVLVCSPSTVKTAKGSGKPKHSAESNERGILKISCFVKPSAAMTIVQEVPKRKSPVNLIFETLSLA